MLLRVHSSLTLVSTSCRAVKYKRNRSPLLLLGSVVGNSCSPRRAQRDGECHSRKDGGETPSMILPFPAAAAVGLRGRVSFVLGLKL